MKKTNVLNQLSNFETTRMYVRQLMTLAENVFQFKNLPEFIDVSFLNRKLTRTGSIAFFKDEVLGVIALPYVPIGELDIYGRPNRIQVFSYTGGYQRTLNRDEYVIMYDNNGRYPLWLDIKQYAERLALYVRTIDINVSQQKTPRFWKCKSGQELSIKKMLNEIDSNDNSVLTYDNIDVDDIELVLEPAPYVADKLNFDKDKLFNEFLRLVGISNLSFQKKERAISDEVQALQGGTIASRYSRFEPRKRAIDEINAKFGTNIEVEYYDGMPTSIEELNSLLGEEIMNIDEEEVATNENL